MRRSKILCTLGPASAEPAVLRDMIAAGMDAVRLNFSHGHAAGHAQVLERVRAVAREFDRPLPVLQDLGGPKIRVGDVGPAGLVLAADSEVELYVGQQVGTQGQIPVGYPALTNDLRPGDAVLLDDGLLRLEVLAVRPAGVRCRVVAGGRLTSRKGLNLPGTQLSVPSLTPKDHADLAAGLHMGVDLVALSFVRSAADIRQLRALVRQAGKATPIIAKIEKPEALDDLAAILREADGVMVARGDLGVELSPERVPLIQRHIVQDASAAGKLVIIATQMLESMVHSPRPTRAEVQDVASAIMQGADATMLSGETAAGEHPVAAVAMMDAIIREVEAGMRAFEAPDEPPLIAGIAESASAVGRAAVQAARDLRAACLVVFSRSGRTARLVSQYRPAEPIVAFTPRSDVWRALGLSWGVTPIAVAEEALTSERAAELARGWAVRLGLARPGDRIVVTMGQPAGPEVQTNLLWVQDVAAADRDRLPPTQELPR